MKYSEMYNRENFSRLRNVVRNMRNTQEFDRETRRAVIENHNTREWFGNGLGFLVSASIPILIATGYGLITSSYTASTWGIALGTATSALFMSINLIRRTTSSNYISRIGWAAQDRSIITKTGKPTPMQETHTTGRLVEAYPY